MAIDIVPEIPAGVWAARKVRAIVEAKENFVWATDMESLCVVFGIEHLGKVIVDDTAMFLTSEGLNCFPNPIPSQKKKSVIIMLKNTRFADGFEP